MSDHDDRGASSSYLVFILILSLLALGALLAQRILPLASEERRVLEIFDLAVCIVFFFDFLVALATSRNRMRYLATWGWLDLLSSIPEVAALRWARSARILRIFRLLRVMRAARVLSRALSFRRRQSGLTAAAITGLTVLLLSSVAILQVETDPGANIATAEDAIWWALTTMTTVGYGDRYPISTEGRIVGAALMLIGVGLFGVLTAFLASHFVSADETKLQLEIVALRQEVSALREVLTPGDRPSDLGGRD